VTGVLLPTLATAALAAGVLHAATTSPQRDAGRPASGTAASGASRAPVAVSDSKLLGQRIMVGMRGTAPDRALLGAVQRGEVGSVILFASNIVDRPQVTALTASLQRSAREGGNPPLLIAIDQEGGAIRRFVNGPPFSSPPQLGQRGSAAVAFRQGAITGQYLRARGINMDLAPVLDVPTSPNAFIWQEGRAFSFSARTVATVASAFALGVQSARVAATGKHFPGVGSAPVDTDNRRQELTPSAVQRGLALEPYESLIPRGLDAVMLATAGFPGYDRSGRSAALSGPIINGLLRGRLKFAGVTITDSIDSPTGYNQITAGDVAAAAGADILLFTDSAPGELRTLLSALHGGRISRSQAVASYQRILALKRRVAG
jgi:beta-N-acetylhexosaminidase